eukprot:scaffold147642_cov22-Tisochrysis_lutea.AAC.1
MTQREGSEASSEAGITLSEPARHDTLASSRHARPPPSRGRTTRIASPLPLSPLPPSPSNPRTSYSLPLISHLSLLSPH